MSDTVSRLLHDAEHADNGATFAETLCRDAAGAKRLREKRDRLLAEARALDPKQEHPDWQEVPQFPAPSPEQSEASDA